MKTMIGIRVSELMKQALQKLADQDHRTLSNYIYKVLIEHLEELQIDYRNPGHH